MAAKTTKEVAWINGPAKDDSFADVVTNAQGSLSPTTTTVAALLANDAASSTYVGVYTLAEVQAAQNNASTKSALPTAKNTTATSMGGSISVSGGVVTYTPPPMTPALAAQLVALPAGASIADNFYYIVWVGNNGAYSTAKASVLLTGINDVPTFISTGAGSVVEDTSPFTSGTLSITDPDTGESGFQAQTATSGALGSLNVKFGGGWDYTLDGRANSLAQGETASETFNVKSFDGTKSTTVTISITGTNDAPTAKADTASTTENASITIAAASNDEDPDHNAALNVTSATASKGTATVSNGQIVWDPGSEFNHLAQGASETVTVNYVVSDEFGATSSSTVTITVTGQNDGPTANPDTSSGGENSVQTVNALGNDTDPDDGAQLSLVSASADKGSASVVDGKVQFNPGAAFDHLAQGTSEDVTVNYTITDEFGAQSSSSITVTVNGENDTPTANSDTSSGGENSVQTIDALANDTDPDDGAGKQLVSVAASAGAASIADGKVQFDPGSTFDHLKVGASATVTIDYTMSDEHGAQSSSSITVTVNGENDGPTANADTGVVNENASVSVAVLANDTDPDDDAALSLVSVSGSGASMDGNNVVFTAGASFDHLVAGATQDVVIDYTMSDENGAQSSSSVKITVTGVNDPASIGGGLTGVVVEDGVITATGTATVSDVDDGQNHFGSHGATDGTYGKFTFDDTTGQWSYTLDNSAVVNALNTGDNRSDSLSITSADGTATANIEIAIQGHTDADPNGAVKSWMVNHGLDTINQRTQFIGFDGNDVLKSANNVKYLSSNDQGDGFHVFYEYKDGKTTENIEIVLVGYHALTAAQIT
ncbi:VCBS domain-containing protein [Ramlibacter albus]|uniref:Tandem-95 repeat protein n=1 Tax=Ramlibacter albus TaxID=2079448 RepID=A0A923M9M2_9BURK|nr:VCBS domain-containing protein [Ramlibacter albus]MBC5765299.1 tandem-95 repeat protein [Ramlibacter albus]